MKIRSAVLGLIYEHGRIDGMSELNKPLPNAGLQTRATAVTRNYAL
jgi:hypothetical protein